MVSFISKITMGVFLLLCSCHQQKVLSREAYLAWYNSANNTVIKTKTVGMVTMDAKYKNTDFYLASHPELTKEEIQSMCSNQNSLDFDLRLTSNEKSIRVGDVLQQNMSEANVNDLSSILAFGLRENAKIYTAEDTISCVVFHQIRNYDLAPYIDFSIEFPWKKPGDALQKGFTLALDLTDLKLGIVKFDYSQQDLETIPHLEFN